MTETTASISDSEKPVTFGSFLSKNLSSERFNVFTNSKAAPLFSKVSNLKMSKENISQRLLFLNEEIYNLSMLINAKQFEESSFTSSLDIIDDKIKELQDEIARTDEHNPILNLTGKDFDEIFARYGLKFICVYSATDNARIYFYKPSHMVGDLPVGPVVYYLKYISSSSYKMIFSEAFAYPVINIASRDNGYDTYFHPHINALNGSAYDNATIGSAYYGKVCLGNFGDILSKARVTLAMDSFEEHVALFNSLVQTYNSGSPYRRPDQIIPLYEERGMMHNLTKKVGLPSKEKQKYLPSANINLGIFNTYVASGKIPFNAITNVDDIRSFCKSITSGTSLYDIIEKRINTIANDYFYDGCTFYTGDADYVWRKIQITRSSEVIKAIEQNPEIDIINMINNIFSKLEKLFSSMYNNYLMEGNSLVHMSSHSEVLKETYSILSSYDVLQSVSVSKAGTNLLSSIKNFEEFISGTNASEVNVSEDSRSSDADSDNEYTDEDTDDSFETEYEVDDSEYTDEDLGDI